MLSLSINTKQLKALFFGALLMCGFFGFANMSAAYVIEDISGATDENLFVVGPTKTDFVLEKGKSATLDVKVSNLTGDTRDFILEVEDFTASPEWNQAIMLLGAERGPYSLRDYIKFSQKTFTLRHGERAVVPVTVSVPMNAEPGGLYGALLVSMQPLPKVVEGERVINQTPLVKRIGSLFYVRVAGPVKEEASLVSFDTVGSRRLFGASPVTFNILVENKGNIHLVSEGEVVVTNMFGDVIDELKVDRWFVMPDSIRLRDVNTSRDLMIGRYRADLSLKMFGDKVEERAVVFWVLPWKLLLLVFVIALIILWILRWVSKNFKISRV